jgi:hypothetical protein
VCYGLLGHSIGKRPAYQFSNGPPDKAAKAWEAITMAKTLSKGVSPLEKSLIDALSHRYANPQPEDRSNLDQDYAYAMREVWKIYSENAEFAPYSPNR